MKTRNLAAIAVATLLLASCASQISKPTAPAATDNTSKATTDDPFLWLEETLGERALAWVDEQNARTKATEFASGPAFDKLDKELVEVMTSDERIPYARKMGGFFYNYWKDKQHPRGIWRRTTLASYQSDSPQWETVLDVDALGKTDGHAWVWKGAQCLEPEYLRCLISLSPQGGDAVVVREFDLHSKQFVENGFHLPVAKTNVDWIDIDHIYVGTDFGPGSMTESSYPRIVKQWTRGTPLSAAETLFEGKPTDMAVHAWHDNTPGFERDFVQVTKDFFHSKLYLSEDGNLIHVEVPSDAIADVHREWLLVQTKSTWKVGGSTYPSGSLLATHFDDFMAGDRNFEVLFTPDQHTALSSHAWTRHRVLVTTLHDVKSQVAVLAPQPDGSWTRTPLPGVPDNSTVRVSAIDADHDDAYWMTVSGFLTPTTLRMGTIGEGPAVPIKQAPSFFDTSNFTVSQHFVTSRDGTRVPYFQVAPKGMKLDGSNRTLLYGYGGFAISLLPRYSGRIGRAWLARGGVYVVANIRGGGAYGPSWHQAAMKANRPRAYEDFAAVAQDLVDRGVTSPKHLGAQGGSNGGLLMGNMLVSYPHLFGAIACNIPLLDMKRYIHLQAGASWIGEYGDPSDPEQWAFIRKFSPYQLVKPGQNYPDVLFYTATSDDRVGPEQARKMAARMQQMGYKNVWFFENREGGHGAGADARQSASMYAMDYNFLWQKLQ